MIRIKPMIACSNYMKARAFAHDHGWRDFEFDHICDSLMLRGLRGSGRVVYVPDASDLGMGSILMEARLQELEVRAS